MQAVPVVNMEKTGKNIETMRRKAGLTVRDLQKVFNFSTPQAIYKWQHGESLPNLDNLLILSTILKARIEDILVVDIVIVKNGTDQKAG